MADVVRFPLTDRQNDILRKLGAEMDAMKIRTNAYFQGCVDAAPLEAGVEYEFSWNDGSAVCTPKE